MKLAVRLGAVAVLAAIAVAQTGTGDAASPSRTGRAGTLSVVAAFYPLAFAAERVGGSRVRVTNLTPAGVEPHDLELTSGERDAIDDADVVLVMGRGFQPAVERAARSRSGITVELLRALRIDAPGTKVAEDGDGGPLDPHVWLDPTLMSAIVDRVERALAAAEPRAAATFAANAAALRGDLRALDERYRTGLAECARRVIVTSHAAFGYLARAYDLTQEAVAGLSPDTEPGARRLAELADLVQRKGVTTIFTEELVSPRLAETLAREAGGVRTDTLDPLEGLTRAELRRGGTYLTVMDRNLVKLRRALGCR